ncbi:MAG: hypothetical protein AAB676_16260 [Verrucomicrobiota bacterium]
MAAVCISAASPPKVGSTTGPLDNDAVVVSDFQYDVFLSHSAKDQAAMRPLAE